ncbi:RdgB/HAM1 family non-canonical purine NTP pyrophosphatase [Caldichromatium japonicum]|uniref:dITP/XTP pyrophosphatase n=1 Tax=Caldichromatium japonicum TaxID=2699430 RepID=A0A6G7VA51_9GAMM|nr:RdgB/HAM1 family non-canonical purine NTP pyrophosphatase [Caldichromatium japonicum]QIK36891.1 RdgB/HAM1 family non-canonical purine NTP pyrophosphatase [Caldichromatium japonicum]
MRLPSAGLLILASDNPGKMREIARLLAGLPFEVRSQGEYGVPAVEETGLSFVENAILKARQACRYTGLPAIADDSGLEVDALAGAPGIYSARYAGPKATDEENLRKLLDALQCVPEAERTARFQCAIVYLRHAEDPMPLVCQGTWEGRILFEPRGTQGFGYDPVFLVPTQGCSAAELDPELKNQLSHRGQALQRLRQWFAA